MNDTEYLQTDADYTNEHLSSVHNEINCNAVMVTKYHDDDATVTLNIPVGNIMVDDGCIYQ
jgi:hypothetical protein